ncbi:protein FAM102B-like isoform X2 [Eurytemora carolleeae]|nr:protein FAM102B-like isoform X2 [Eurytemora carolleeae]XP_023326621.1 protein FAM102B-like isoform X2 [Eurytemora carolleeae]|eukprot:XP_023326620.1 protein FAM102B-like isoform X2 [Eurytemora affinis]
MAFIIKKKRYKFQAELILNDLTEVSFGKAILFAKVRQLDGGSFTALSKRMEVSNHTVKYDEKFQFPCKMNANSNTGVLESCRCRVGIRKEEKGGKNYRKIGFVDVDLAEYAGAGPSTQRYILQAYDQHHRLDNSMLQITLNITLKEGDLVFQRPLTRQQPILLPGEEDAALALSVNTRTMLTLSDLAQDTTHTRNSSSTSQPSQTGSVGYSSQCSATVPGAHSRQSSADSSHARNLSAGSADTGFCGSMEKEKRKKRIDSGRVDPQDVINELMEDLHLDSSTATEGSQGLQLYLGPHGEVRFDQPKLNSQFKPVLIDKR